MAKRHKDKPSRNRYWLERRDITNKIKKLKKLFKKQPGNLELKERMNELKKSI